MELKYFLFENKMEIKFLKLLNTSSSAFIKMLIKHIFKKK